MKHVNLIYRLDGEKEKIQNGLSVFEIAPILLSVGELIKEANKTIGESHREIAVNVKPFRNGSFIVDIVIFAQNNLQQIIDYVNHDNVKEIKELLEWIGLIGAGGSTSLYFLIKKLKGKPKSIEQLKPNEIRYTAEDGTAITVPNQVHQLFQNGNIQNVFYNGFGKPLEQTGIKKIETYLEGDADEERVEFSKKESEYLKNYSSAEIPSLDLEEEIESVMEVFLSPKRGSFDADPRQWSFRMGSENQVITATIKDEDFLEKCRTGEIKPHHTDILKVRLIQKIKRINEKLDLNSISFEVEKILDYQIGNQNVQFNLLDDRNK